MTQAAARARFREKISEEYQFPVECQEELEMQIVAVAMGRSAIAARSEAISVQDVLTTASRISDVYNEMSKRKQAAIDDERMALRKQYDQGDMDAAEVFDQMQNIGPDPAIACRTFSTTFAYRMLKNHFDFTKVNTAGMNLPYDDPLMAAARARFREKISDEKISIGLVLNHDHIWKANYRPKARALRKPRNWVGKRRCKSKLSPDQCRKVAAAMRIPTEDMIRKKRRSGRTSKRDRKALEDTRLSMVQNGRKAMTFITSTWAIREGNLGGHLRRHVWAPGTPLPRPASEALVGTIWGDGLRGGHPLLLPCACVCSRLFVSDQLCVVAYCLVAMPDVLSYCWAARLGPRATPFPRPVSRRLLSGRCGEMV